MDIDRVKNAYKYLELLQRAYLNKHGTDSPHSLEDVPYEKLIKQVLKDEDEASAYVSEFENIIHSIVPKTRYQNPLTYSILLDIVEGIDEVKEQVLGASGLDIEMPCFGTVDAHVFDACIQRPEECENLIVLSDGLFTFANLMSKIFVLLLPFDEYGEYLRFSTKKEDILKHIESHPEVKLRFFDLMLACLLTGEPPRARQYFVDSSLFSFVNIICRAFETFVVSHEYAHSILDHLDFNVYAERKLTISQELIEALHDGWEAEIDADLYGAGLTLAVMQKAQFDPYVSMLGIFACTKSFELFDRIKSMKSGNDDKISISRTHPPGFIRQKLILNYYLRDMDLGLFETLNEVIDSLWDEFSKFTFGMKDFFENEIKLDFYDVPFALVQDLVYRIFNNSRR